MTKTRHNAPRIVFMIIAVIILVYGGLASLAYGFSANGGTVAIQSPTVEIESDSVGDVVTVVGDRNVVNTAVSPDQPQRQGSWLIVPIVLLLLGLAVVGVYHLLISGALNTAVDTFLLWRKS